MYCGEEDQLDQELVGKVDEVFLADQHFAGCDYCVLYEHISIQLKNYKASHPNKIKLTFTFHVASKRVQLTFARQN